MQDRATVPPKSSPFSSPVPNADIPEFADRSEKDAASTSPSPIEAEPAGSNLDQSLVTFREKLGEHKGKLAISAAATLGLIVYYQWREKKLAEEEPQEYERLRRIKNRVRHADDRRRVQEKIGEVPVSSEKTGE